MYHFRKFWLSIFLVLTSVLYITSQNEVTVMISIQPPYTPYIADYIQDTGKVIVTLNYTSATGAPMDVYLHGSFTGASTGINVYTDPNYMPPVPIHLENGQTYQLSPDEIGELYTMESVIYEGITPEEIMTSGALPEDYYQLCVQAFKYDTYTPVSQSAPGGCSSQFLISNIDPPIIVAPSCGEEIETQNPQNIYVNWTQPVGTNPLFLTYYFRMVEVPFDSGIDPIDALTETSYASIYEEEIFNGTSLLLTNDKVQLSPNNTYAFSVQALSDAGDYFFKNNGVSEACWFTYTEEESANGIVQTDDNISMLEDFIDQFELIPATKVSGHLFYKVPENAYSVMSHEMQNPLNQPQDTIPASTGINYTDMSHVVLGYTGNADSNHIGIQESPNNIGYQIQLPPPEGRGLMHSDTESIDYNKPLPNTKVRLVARLAVFDHGPDFPSYFENPNGSIQGRGQAEPIGLIPIKDLDNQEHDANPNFINMVLDVTETDEDGNFSFDFRSDFFTAACQVTKTVASSDEYAVPIPNIEDIGQEITNPVSWVGLLQGVDFNPSETSLQQGLLGQQNQHQGQQQTMSLNLHLASVLNAYICLKVEVVNPKFCSPDVDIFAMPGDVVDVGNQVAKLKTYNAEILVKSNDTKPQILKANEGIPNTKIKILRDEANLITEHPIVLKEEGDKLNSNTLTEDGKEFKDVSIGLTSMQSENLGKITLKNLVKHWSGSTSGLQIYTNQIHPYYISVATRDGSVIDSDYENTFYNYKGKFQLLPTNTNNAAVVNDNIAVICNNAYHVPTIPFEYTLEPEKPEIKGRVMAHSNIEDIALEGANIMLITQKDDSPAPGLHTYISNGGLDNIDSFNSFMQETWLYNMYHQFKLEKEITSPHNGFFRFTNLNIIPENNVPKGPFRRIIITKEGYHPQVFPSFDEPPYNLNNGELVNISEIHLIPSNDLKGKVVDDEGNPVVAYVRVLDNGPYYKTTHNPLVNQEYFNIAAAKKGNRIEIEPLSSSRYFTRTFENVDISNERQTFVVYKKLHRLWLTVTNQQGDILIGADVVVGDSLAVGKTDVHGVFRAKFTTSDMQFVLKINANNYAPHQSILDLPITENWTYQDIQLTQSFAIFGYISDAQTQEKIPDAKVFAEIDNTDGHHLYLEASTNSEGYYNLKGIPWGTNQLELHISKDGNNPSYIGKTVDINVGPHNMEYYNFELNSIVGWDLSQILGFPMQVEGIKSDQNNSNRKILKGYLHDMPTTLGFATQESNAKLFFEGILVEKDAQGKVTPVADEVILNEIQVPLKINYVFVGKLMKPVFGNGEPTSKLKLEKIFADKARIKSGVKLDLESFRSEYSFAGNFYIGDNTDSYAATVFNSNTGNLPQQIKRPVFDIGFDASNYGQAFPKPIEGYEVYKFRADATLEDSFLQGNKVNLKTILHTEIPMGNNPDLDLKLPIGSVVVTQNDINIVKGPTEDLKFNLEKWKVIAKDDWEFNKNEETIVLKEVLILSSNFSASVKNIKVRPNDQLREGQVDVQGGLSLGGIAPLVLADGLEPLFNYDATAGSGHYRISLVGSSNTEEVAYVDGDLLEGTDDNITFTSVGMLSNDVTVLSLNKTMRFHDIMNVNVNQIMTGDGAFSLKGRPNFNNVNGENEIYNTGIPGYVPTNVIINYEKEGNNPELAVDIKPLQGQVDCNNNVTFIIDNEKEQTFEKHKFTMLGKLKVAPSANDEGDDQDSFYLDGMLTKTNDEAKIDVLESKLYLGTKELNVFEGNIDADIPNDRWNLLNFSAKPDQIALGGLKEETIFDFSVSGNVSVGSDNIQVNEMDFGFGSMEMSFNFNEPSIYGVLHYQGNHISLGYVSVKPYTLALLIDPNGLYIGSTANVRILSFPLFDFDGAIVVGYTTTDLNSKVLPLLNGYRINKPNFSSGLKGFYILGQRSINRGIDIGIADASIEIAAGAYVYCNFADGSIIKLGGYGYAYGGGSIDAVVCDFSVYLGNQFLIDATYENGSFSFCNSCNLNFDFEIDCPDPFDFSTQKSYTLKISDSGWSWGDEQCK